MNSHPTNRAERLKLKSVKQRRKTLLEEAIKKQEAEDELKKLRSGSLPEPDQIIM